MKKIIVGTLVVVLIYTLGFIIGIETSKPKLVIHDKPKLSMELCGVTPNGHQVYRKFDNGSYIYVLLRTPDGYPIGIAK